jgi:hypothetical protein
MTMPPIRKLAEATMDKSSLGNLILREGILTLPEFNELLAEFNDLKVEELLGQFLVRKDVLSPEKLELLLIRQEAERNGGVEKKHVRQALRLAHSTTQKVQDGVDDFVSCTQVALAKVTEAK